MSSRRGSSLLPLLAASLLACAHNPVDGPSSSTRPAPPRLGEAEAWYGDLHALARRAAAVRDLELTQTFEVTPLDDDAFFALYAELTRTDQQEVVNELRALLAAFASETADVEVFERLFTADAAAVRQEQLIAFYHFPTHRLAVRAALPTAMAEAGEDVRRAVLAHEVGHVLHDQLGAFRKPTGGFDESMALRALLEGDATLTATLLEGSRKGLAPERAVERARVTLSVLTADQVVAFGGFSPKLLAAPPVVRAMFLFPYFQGQRFVDDLYAAGGLPLVNQALASPPRTTNSLFAPQRWLRDGERRFSAPPGALRMGALLARTMFEHCSRASKADVAPLMDWLAAHVIDDAVVGQQATLRWTVAWELPTTSQPSQTGGLGGLTPKLAQALAPELVQTLSRCLGSDASDVHVAGGQVGLAADGAAGARAAASLALSRPGPALSEVHEIPGPRMAMAFRSAGPGQLEAGRWRHSKLGLTLTWPAGLPLRDNPSATVTGIARGVMVMGAFVDEHPGQRADDGFFNAVLSGFFKATQRSPPDFDLGARREWRPVGREGVATREAEVAFADGLSARARVVALCDGRAAFYLVGVALEPSKVGLVDGVLNSLQVMGPAALCDEP